MFKMDLSQFQIYTVAQDTAMNRIQIGVLLCLSLVFLVPTAVLGQ